MRPDGGSASNGTVVIRLTPLHPPAQARHQEPVTVGVPLPKGLCHDPADLGLEDRDGAPQRRQVSALDRWADGSLRWALLDAQLSAGACDSAQWRLLTQPARSLPETGPCISVSGSSARYVIDTGRAVFTVSAGDGFPLGGADVTGGTVFDPKGSRLYAHGTTGTATAAIDDLRVELAGPLRSVVLALGRFVGSGAASTLRFAARLHFYAGSATIRLSLRLHNPRPARHRRNQWPLGDPGSVLLRAVELSLALGPAIESVRCAIDLESAAVDALLPFELYQDSSGGEQWDSPVHRNRQRIVPVSFRGFRATAPDGSRQGLRASPVATVRVGEVTSSVALPGFWQNCPRALSVDDRSIVIGLFPRQYADLHELQGGERKTHEVVLAFAGDAVADPPLSWAHAPMRLACDPEWYAQARALPFLTPASANPCTTYRMLVRAAIEGHDTFEAKRERVDEYGWRHFGDLYADHEAVFHEGPDPLVSHYNNQYDAIRGLAAQFFQDRDPRWWPLLDDLARHVTDIDVYHTTGDKAAYNQGLFWHTNHYVDAGTATHRAYPGEGASGGGPSAEHNYTTGLMLHYFLTGEAPSREAALMLADWVLAMDDGRHTVFRFLARGATGLASSTGSSDYHGPGRGPANSITACLNACRLSGDRRYLDKAEQLIRRCIHPADDPGARELLDPERRWSYTVFLQALGDYLLYKEERQEIDVMHTYARSSLAAYAGWMAAAERPYLDRPALLEYPNETWAAQDMRKSEVFELAALHATGADRDRLLDRAQFFFDVSTHGLAQSKTATLTRPVVLMLSYGWQHAWFVGERGRLGSPVADPAVPFPLSERFEPQKRIALRRAIFVVSTMGAVALAAVLSMLMR